MAREDLKRYAVTKVISAQHYDIATNELLCETKHVKTFNVSDSTPLEKLEGGENMDALLYISGKQEASFEYTTATDSLGFKALQLNTTITKGIKEVPTDAYFTVESEKVTLGVVKIGDKIGNPIVDAKYGNKIATIGIKIYDKDKLSDILVYLKQLDKTVTKSKKKKNKDEETDDKKKK